jgi:ABC-type antimicrobial peptide transport system permease subunit
VLFAAFGAVLALVAAALLTSLMAAVRRRKVEFAVVRVIGLTRSGLLSMLLVEYAVVFIVGVSVGCGMGLFVSDRMLSFLDVTETGDRVEPGYILETRWWLVGLGVAVVLAVFMLAVWLASRVVARGGEGTVLRGE